MIMLSIESYSAAIGLFILVLESMYTQTHKKDCTTKLFAIMKKIDVPSKVFFNAV